MMKRFLLGLSLALLSLSVLAPQGVEAKRLGGGGSMGMKRTTPPPRSTPAPNPPATPAQPGAAAATPATPAPAPAAAPKRSWMGPLAGLAAGLGLAALMSHFGMGEGFANILMLALLAFAAFAVIRLLMRRFAPQPAPQGNFQFAGAGPAGAGDPPWQPAQGNWGTQAAPTPAQPVATSLPAASVALPPDFDAAAFERTAKLIFMRMQAANDASDLNDLRSFTTPEMFAAVKLDLQERGNKPQQTDVVKLDVELVDASEDAVQRIVSVRFHGLIREEIGGAASAFDEVWHLVQPRDGSRDWAIAGIAQTA